MAAGFEIGLSAGASAVVVKPLLFEFFLPALRLVEVLAALLGLLCL